MNAALFRGILGTLLFSMAGWALGAAMIHQRTVAFTPELHAQSDLRDCVRAKDSKALAHFSMGNSEHNRFVAECEKQIQRLYHDSKVPSLGG